MRHALLLFACQQFVVSSLQLQTDGLSDSNISSKNSSVSSYNTTTAASRTMSAHLKYISVDFEVYGRVQGVFFRKFTQMEADKLGLSGWCMNTEHGTVKGNIKGSATKINEMKNWLQQTGSPKSQIEKAVFSQDMTLTEKPRNGFTIRR